MLIYFENHNIIYIYLRNANTNIFGENVKCLQLLILELQQIKKIDCIKNWFCVEYYCFSVGNLFLFFSIILKRNLDLLTSQKTN